MQRKCQTCGIDISDKDYRRKFCSNKCSGKSRIGKNNPYWKGKKEFICNRCSKKFKDYPYRSRTKRQFCSQKCARKKIGFEQRGKNNPRWKGGKIIDGHGYVNIHKPDHKMAKSNGYVSEHRLIMSKYLQRDLESSEEIHHINENITDNRIENLKLLSKSEHTKEHHRKRGYNIK